MLGCHKKYKMFKSATIASYHFQTHTKLETKQIASDRQPLNISALAYNITDSK